MFDWMSARQSSLHPKEMACRRAQKQKETLVHRQHRPLSDSRRHDDVERTESAGSGSEVLEEETDTSDPGLLYAAGLLTGAGLMGLAVAFVIVIYTLSSDVAASDSNPMSRVTHLDNSSITFLSAVQLSIIVYTMFLFGVRNIKGYQSIPTSN
jgi:hypothetical protein